MQDGFIFRNLKSVIAVGIVVIALSVLPFIVLDDNGRERVVSPLVPISGPNYTKPAPGRTVCQYFAKDTRTEDGTSKISYTVSTSFVSDQTTTNSVWENEVSVELSGDAPELVYEQRRVVPADKPGDYREPYTEYRYTFRLPQSIYDTEKQCLPPPRPKT